MICLSCVEQKHGGCKGGTWCDCQHRGFSSETPNLIKSCGCHHDEVSVSPALVEGANK